MMSTQKYFSNEKVSASAGSGKTFSLTTRFIALACVKNNDEKFNPFSIIALTFTKKAAGEFLTKILTRLADASISEDNANKLADNVSEALPVLSGDMRPTRETFASLLKECAKSINKLHLSTIDSFFSTIIKQNASTLKIFAPVKISDEEGVQAQQFMLDSIEKMMEHNVLSDEELHAFAELIKRAAFGKEQKQYRDVIESSVKMAHAKYLLNPDLSKWGNPKISNVEYNYTPYDSKKYEEKFAIVEHELGGQKEFAKLLDFLRKPVQTTLSSASSSVLDFILEEKRNNNLQNIYSIPYAKKSLTLSCAKEIDEMLDVVFTEHFQRLCHATKAVGKIAALFEEEYNASVRSKGNITFSDMPFILSDNERQIDKQFIEYKLDSKFKHWLFDEFQDTSITQWNVLKNLAEEAILSPEKSFYYVGDIKQSIYSWRGATPALFNGISDYYNSNAELILKSKPLTVSWRSGKNVIEVINKIFENSNMLSRAFNSVAADIFSNEFQPHISAESLNYKHELPSYARLQFYKASRNSDDDTKQICSHILKILKETEPLRHGITCAVLVSKNAQANAIVDFLKQNGYNASGELAVNIARDRPIISLFTAILRKIVHPQNTASDAYCNLADIIDFTDNFSDEFIERTTAKIFTDGFNAFAQQYRLFVCNKFKKVDTAIELKWLEDVCTQLDNDGVFSIDEAVEIINSKKVNTSSSKSVIQVMTIHKSKGLAFGMVIMPIKVEMRTRQNLLNIGNSIMISPSSTLASMNAKLFEVEQQSKVLENFETICKIYVGATRPERALYIIAPEFSSSAFTSDNESKIPFSRLLLEAFDSSFKNYAPKDAKQRYNDIISAGGKLDIGDASWIDGIEQEQIPTTNYPVKILKDIPCSTELESFVPSSANSHNKEDDKQAQLGTRVHSFFEKLTSITNFDISTLSVHFPEEPALVAGISRLVSNIEFKQFFDQHNAFEANEMPYSRIENNKQIVGCIDRIVAIKDTSNFKNVSIIDYKPTTKNATKYIEQMQQYKNAVTHIFNVPQENINCFIAGYFDGNVVKIL